MDFGIIIGLDILSGVTALILISLGLAIIFGMMRVINLAHGEFLMLGAYATVLAANHGVNIWFAMLVISPLFVGLVGLFIERTLISVLYGRLVDTMLATWGLSLFLIGLVTTIFGNTIRGVSAPLGGFTIGQYTSSLYTLFLAFMAIVLLVLVAIVLRMTRFGLIARATMQNPAMAAALGVNPARIYMGTFALGAALTGLAGGLLAPVSGVLPTMGSAFIAKAFIAVVGGGAAMIAGTASSGVLFGTINQLASYMTTPVFGEVTLFIAAIVLIRLLPQGITGRFFRGSL
jgi:branched-subunit amino acid ABC-type transport system permease component